MPNNLKDKLENLFVNDQGVGFYIYRAMENLNDIKAGDIELICS